MRQRREEHTFRRDCSLTELGFEQAEMLGSFYHKFVSERMSGQKVTFYCSAMMRTMQTIQPLCTRVGIYPEVHPELRECGGELCQTEDEGIPGNGTGLRRSELLERFPGFSCDLLPADDSPWYTY